MRFVLLLLLLTGCGQLRAPTTQWELPVRSAPLGQDNYQPTLEIGKQVSLLVSNGPTGWGAMTFVLKVRERRLVPFTLDGRMAWCPSNKLCTPKESEDSLDDYLLIGGLKSAYRAAKAAEKYTAPTAKPPD